MVDCVGCVEIMPPVKYEKSNTFKNIGSFIGAAALIPATVRSVARTGANPDVFIKFIKNGPSLGDHIVGATMTGFGEKLFNGTLKLFEKSKGSRIAAVAFGLTAITGLYMGAGRLLGAIPDAIVNSVRKHKAEQERFQPKKPIVVY